MRSVAEGALRLLAAGAPAADAEPSCELLITRLTLSQLSRLAYLQAGEPVVDQVLEALRAGRAVHLDRPAVEAALGLGAYPPRMQEQFARWFVRIAGYGVHLAQGEATPAAPAVPAPVPAARTGPVVAAAAMEPERAVLAEILGNACPADRPCLLEPSKACCGSGRCKALGF